MSNAECVLVCKPYKAGLKRTATALYFLQRTTAIRCEVRLASARFRLRRDTIDLPCGTLDCDLFGLLPGMLILPHCFLGFLCLICLQNMKP